MWVGFLKKKADVYTKKILKEVKSREIQKGKSLGCFCWTFRQKQGLR